MIGQLLMKIAGGADDEPSRIRDIPRQIRDLPDNIRLAALSAWRGRERGMAVFAGVFLASLVITTVLSYGVGLSQVFFEGSLEST